MRARWIAAGVGLSLTGCLFPKGIKGDLGDTRMSASVAVGEPAPKTDDLPAKKEAALNLTMAESLEKQGKEEDAVGYYLKARELSPAVADRVSRRLAVLYDRLDHQAEAMAEFQTLLKAHPKDAALLSDVGYSYYNRGNWIEAEAHLRRAVAADKTHKRAWANLGMTLAQQGKTADAVEAFGKAMTAAEAHANVGFVLAANHKPADAAAEYRKALALEPTLKVAQAAVAKLEATDGDKAAGTPVSTVGGGRKPAE